MQKQNIGKMINSK